MLVQRASCYRSCHPTCFPHSSPGTGRIRSRLPAVAALTLEGGEEAERLLRQGQLHLDVADLLRGPYKPAQYGKAILPLTVLRRLDCVLEPTKAEVLAKHESLKGGSGARTSSRC